MCVIVIMLFVMLVLLWIVIVIKGWNVICLNCFMKNVEQVFWYFDNFDDGIKKFGFVVLMLNDNLFFVFVLLGKEVVDYYYQM